MDKDNGFGRHISEENTDLSNNSVRRKGNFTINIPDQDFDSTDYNTNYNLENFTDKNADSGKQHGRSTEFAPHSTEISSFSNNNAKNMAMKSKNAELRSKRKELKKIAKEKDKNNKRIFMFFNLIACIIVGLVIGKYMIVGFNDFLAVNRTSNDIVTITIGENPDVDTVADTLEKNGIIENKSYFKLFAKLTKSDTDFTQGTFEIAKNLDYQAIISFLNSNSNRLDIVTVQFTEGMNVLEIANKLKDNGVITDVNDILSLCNSDQFDEDFSFLKDTESEGEYYKLEGYLYPDTYDFYINENPASVVEKFINNYENRVYYNTRRVEGYDKKIAIGKLLKESEYSADEIMIIASIIQAEALNVEDMYNISSVLHNRLNADVDMGVSKLSCDSTIYYPYRSKADVPAEVEGYTSTYDTYEIEGLPAGAICNPGADAILAALLPNDTNYYYFCHSSGEDGSGAQAYYAETYSEHEDNLEEAGLI